MERPQERSAVRSAAIVDADVAVAVAPAQAAPAIQPSPAQIPVTDIAIYRKISSEVERTRLTCCSDPEINSALFINNPVVISVFGMGTVYALFRQAFRPWPASMAANLRYCSPASVVAGLGSFGIATRSLDPAVSRVPQRILLSTLTNVGGAFPYGVGSTIQVYEKFCDYTFKNVTNAQNITTVISECDVSTGAMMGDFFAPNFLIFGIGGACWNSISRERKQALASEGGWKWCLVHGLDILSNSMIFGRNFQFSAMAALSIRPGTVAESWAYGGAIMPALATAVAIKAFPQHEQKINTGALYFMFVNFIYSLWEDVIKQALTPTEHSDVPEEEGTTLSALLIMAALGLFAVGGCVVILKKSTKFIRGRQTIERYVEVKQKDVIVAEKQALYAAVESEAQKRVEQRVQRVVAEQRAKLEEQARAILAEERRKAEVKEEEDFKKELSSVNLDDSSDAVDASLERLKVLDGNGQGGEEPSPPPTLPPILTAFDNAKNGQRQPLLASAAVPSAAGKGGKRAKRGGD